MRLGIAITTVWLGLTASCALAQPVRPAWGAVDKAPPLPLALGGYCAVTLRDRQQWQPGDLRCSVVLDGQRYQFASARERDIFAESAEAYAPMLGGDCPIRFADTGERIAGRLECGGLRSGRLMLFSDDAARERFFADPKSFVDVDLALAGRCVVSLVDANRSVAGIPKTVATHRGLRYYFASAHDRATFLNNPARYDGSAGASPTSPPSPSGTAADGDAADVTPWAHPRVPEADANARQLEGAGEDVLLGAAPSMAGYCPVTLHSDGKWVRGRYDFRVELGSHVFLTAGPKQRDALLRDPVKFVPALGGDCAVSLLAQGEHVRGSVWHAYDYDGRLFLFADAQHKAVFKESPATYALADLAAEGNCVVTRQKERREVRGLPEHVTWYSGRLYRFAGAEQKQTFLAEPAKYAVE